MIRVTKPATPPAILRKRGADALKAFRNAYDAASSAYDSGSKTFKFDAKLYGAASVKNALIKAQRGKCAFCESKVTHVAYGDVEHFRPKAGWVQAEGDKLGRPGYYWLAYDWRNLFFACPLCNQRFKRNLFPLADPATRARNHRDDLARETPLFLDPGADDPAEHLAFREEVAFPVGDSPRGRATIELLGLNREELAEVRRDRLALLRLLIDTSELLRRRIEAGDDQPELRAQLTRNQAALERAVSPDSEFSAMARALIGSARPARRAAKSRPKVSP